METSFRKVRTYFSITVDLTIDISHVDQLMCVAICNDDRSMERVLEMPGVLCDKRVPPRVKGQIHKMIVQPAMLYGMETIPMTDSHV